MFRSQIKPEKTFDNQPFDEVFPVDDPEEIASELADTPLPLDDDNDNNSNDPRASDQLQRPEQEEFPLPSSSQDLLLSDDEDADGAVHPDESELSDTEEEPDEQANESRLSSSSTKGRPSNTSSKGTLKAAITDIATPPETPDGAAMYQEYDSEDDNGPTLGENEFPNAPDSEDTHDDDSQSSSDDSDLGPKMEGAYDAQKYADLNVTEDIKDLFQFITQFEPEVHELETKLKPFIPEFIPAVGDIDAFLKVPRPDGKDQGLGLTVLDEPCANQSDPTVLDLHLRTIAKTTTTKSVKLNQIQNAASNPKAIDNWIHSIGEVHKDKEPQVVHYSSPMPEVEDLMQEWPPEVEQALESVQLPGAELDVSLSEYTDIVCAILDIPIQKSRIESLHLLFSTLVEFKNSQHFQHLSLEGAGLGDGLDDDLDDLDGEDRLTFD